MVGAHYDSDGLIVSFDVPPDIWANIDVTSFGLSAKDGEVQDFVLSPSDAITLGEMGYSVKATLGGCEAGGVNNGTWAESPTGHDDRG